jgi:hypothetical protein
MHDGGVVAVRMFHLPNYSTDFDKVKFQVLTESDYEYGCLLVMEAASTSETSVNFYQTIRRNNPEDSHLQIFIKLKINGSTAQVVG